MEEDGEHEEKVGESVSYGLVDEEGELSEVGESGCLSWGGRLVGLEEEEEGWGEENGSVAVGFEVDTDGVTFGGVVEVFDSGWDAGDGEAL